MLTASSSRMSIPTEDFGHIVPWRDGGLLATPFDNGSSHGSSSSARPGIRFGAPTPSAAGSSPPGSPPTAPAKPEAGAATAAADSVVDSAVGQRQLPLASSHERTPEGSTSCSTATAMGWSTGRKMDDDNGSAVAQKKVPRRKKPRSSSQGGALRRAKRSLAKGTDTATYAEMLKEAIQNQCEGQAYLTEIYGYLQTKFACFVNDSDVSWKNSVRHNLSIHPQFQRISVLSDQALRSSPGKVKGSAGLWTVVPDDQLDKVVLTPSQRRLSASSKSNGGRWGRGRSQSSPETTAPGLAGQALLGKPSPQQSTAFADVAKRPRGDRLTGVTGGMVGTSTSTSLQQPKKIQQLKATVFRIQPVDRRSDKPARMAPGMAPTGGYDDAATTPAHPGPDGRELPSLLIANALLELATYL